MRILTVFGTRPEAIKMSVLVQKLNSNPLFEHKLCVTGQHKELLDQVLNLFGLQPDYNLAIMKPGQDLSDITSRILLEIRNVFTDFKPDLVLVHGDTTTCFATTLAAFYANIRVGHIEAGLRTGNLQAPFPEEANRVMVSRLATYHFAPTQRNVNILSGEGIPASHIIQTGNTVIDALLQIASKVNGLSDFWKNSVLENSIQKNHKILLVTGHRRENFGQGFIEICQALATIAQRYPTLEIIYPVHLNPNVQKPVYEIIGNVANVHLIESLSYEDFIFVMKRAYLILTDSGGVQEEAPSLGKPVLVMRDTTERPEAIDAGTVKLVGANAEKIIQGVSQLLDNEEVYHQMSHAHNPYGDGQATNRIVAFLENIAK